MKNRIFTLIIATMTAFSFILSSCSKEGNEDTISPNDQPEQTTAQETPIEDVRYYVKYNIEANSAYRVNYSYNLSYSKDNGSGNITESNVFGGGFSWDGTYGPFKKNDKVQLSLSLSTKMNITAQISVSRNEEPFTTKAEFKQSSDRCSLEYTIDF